MLTCKNLIVEDLSEALDMKNKISTLILVGNIKTKDLSTYQKLIDKFGHIEIYLVDYGFRIFSIDDMLICLKLFGKDVKYGSQK